MACSFSPSSATRLQALEAAAGGKNARIPLKASVSPPLRSLGSCKAARQEFEGATQDPSVSVSSARTQLDLLEQLTSSPTSDGIESGAPVESRPLTTIREQLSALYGERGGEFTLPMGKKLKEGLKALNSMTVSQRRNIKRQAMLTKVQVFSGHLQTYHTHEGTFALQENCICVYSQNLYMK
ncbi:uncharacterized protein LOC100823674 isoform X2 [Brachypodium distachyon]|uniref:uncharacterized protein LOC100823674 isoform X2 n=1 Tax=Brachypodium distachyon TaxID=15368 RepID=UPI000D0DB52D|nr:uncharacterized protein LOC100823674 isoform X2 [Brachypodium distachyon]|eukprot:XP_024314823.1 uncharacterized protein LOC100823674 isoform X2 [Brachypodium distachyon]